jgi:coenzyme F420-reducing hydrogenase alpha subunit
MSESNNPGVRTINISAIARVEGEGALTIRLKNEAVESVQLRIFEAPRYFEGFLRGRMATEAPDLTARICGICPVAYQMSSVHAIEKIYGITMPSALRTLRRLLYCGEWIESHVLHIFMLHTPDFLGYDSAIALAQSGPSGAKLVRQALRIKKAWNAIIDVLGGRAVHPINVKVGGFYRLPRRDEFASVLEELKWARDAAEEAVHWSGGLQFPEFDGDYEFVSLRHPDEYPMNEGKLVSSRGLEVPQEEFLRHFEEYQVPHSNALQCRRKNAPTGDGVYFVGPQARWNLNRDRAPQRVRELAQAVGLPFPVMNPYQSIVVRCLEVLLAIDEACRILEAYHPDDKPSVDFQPIAGTAGAITEAPRGLIFQQYETDSEGRIKSVVIVPPTSQNQAQIERDLMRFAPQLAKLPDDVAALQAERVIRNYDPCISCATHFLKFKVERQ